MASPMRFKRNASSLSRACLAVVGSKTLRPPMRLVHALLTAGFAVVATVAGAQGPAAGGDKSEQAFPHAYAMRGCTQEDAPALEIYFTRTPFAGGGDPSPPYIRFEISSLPSETIGPVSLALIPLRRDPTKPGRIARAELVETLRDRTWLSGTIALNEAAPGRPVSGRYDVAMPSGRRLGASFTAEYSNRSAVCG